MDDKHIAEFNDKINNPEHSYHINMVKNCKREIYKKWEYKQWRLHNLRRIRDKRLKAEREADKP